MPIPTLWSTQQVAEYLGVHEETVLRWVRAGQIKAAFGGSRGTPYRFRQEEIERYMAERLATASAAYSNGCFGSLCAPS